jgi:hypothetical protein
MPGLVPGIHALLACNKDVDGRDKPGHDKYFLLHWGRGGETGRSSVDNREKRRPGAPNMPHYSRVGRVGLAAATVAA